MCFPFIYSTVTPIKSSTSGEKSLLDDVFALFSQLTNRESSDKLEPIELVGLIACLVAVLVGVLVVLRCVVRTAFQWYEHYASVSDDSALNDGKERRPSVRNGRLSVSRNGHVPVPGSERNLEV